MKALTFFERIVEFLIESPLPVVKSLGGGGAATSPTELHYTIAVHLISFLFVDSHS